MHQLHVTPTPSSLTRLVFFIRNNNALEECERVNDLEFVGQGLGHHHYLLPCYFQH